MDSSRVIKLLYRDHLLMKHSSRKRLVTEIQTKMPPDQKKARISILDGDSSVGVDDKKDPMTNIFVKYLMKELWFGGFKPRN